MAEPSTGNMRWLVQFARRSDLPDSTTGVIENYEDQFTAWADIEPVGTQTFISGFELGIAVTHRITIRWYDRLDEFEYVIRNTERFDGSVRQERFKIQRVAEFEGLQRWSILDVQLEQIL